MKRRVLIVLFSVILLCILASVTLYLLWSYSNPLARQRAQVLARQVADVLGQGVADRASGSSTATASANTVKMQDVLPPPCLHNVHPGISIEEELVTALRACGSVDPRSITPTLQGANIRVYRWGYSTSADHGIAYVKPSDKTVYLIQFSLKPGIQLQDILKSYGMPEYVLRNKPIAPDQCTAYIRLLYPGKGIDFIADPEYKCGEEINAGPGMISDGYELYAPGTLTNVLQQTYSMSNSEVQRNIAGLRLWAGYDSLLGWDGK